MSSTVRNHCYIGSTTTFKRTKLYSNCSVLSRLHISKSKRQYTLSRRMSVTIRNRIFNNNVTSCCCSLVHYINFVNYWATQTSILWAFLFNTDSRLSTFCNRTDLWTSAYCCSCKAATFFKRFYPYSNFTLFALS
ncbi:Uncharacterised protein [Chlamydia trachomatis]|nr:Uncharacterised protein [Chlamydia trachomatis]